LRRGPIQVVMQGNGIRVHSYMLAFVRGALQRVESRVEYLSIAVFVVFLRARISDLYLSEPFFSN
jgi:hypothetical protein